jgi:hypothetical protein
MVGMWVADFYGKVVLSGAIKMKFYVIFPGHFWINPED